ncbi:MAG: hypothetical protein A3C30_02965 [Candidatus Levybacteria bacterium RIFCSPHIGHO2_02_FULL_40_18]|nr:MAG: hypothetical protein A2869_05015 [Candidatus Levybacteria bacterium RIFCSPHIGHO2_01_FULL_40_58]OGH26936.1 MAG: hypothetical protein A3C30_02965 [Candidatus Levybacteria bacterium RIFCSPHIGHO2_02_FULL_40_18]OGH32058.1 MAG: hypothetical protein A3E43_03945 [Candidatus Levybacteria bacterium RIFCSPHIGHO2_12_FULL_40_31]OGH40820.1 MAG: hypothetical protein A2894_04455 [Candidatus Levybacteria bacterium RIFCSPLOWO2_01_FULL_40_64]OGH48676.1 MAG: hypothetical protein A3I54_03385 [Candidatus Lev
MPYLLQRIIALFFLLLSTPLLVLLFLAVKWDSSGPFIFKQKRAGKNKKPFTMYKIRTMVEGAEKLQSRYAKLNEASGPVFKIRNDPRYTRVGKILARIAIDELPQLWNVVKGEMALVGPRPLPLYEANKVPKKFEQRFSVLPGMTSPWIIKGGHGLKFDQWMKLDLEYVKKKSLLFELKILAQTALLIIRVAMNSGR